MSKSSARHIPVGNILVALIALIAIACPARAQESTSTTNVSTVVVRGRSSVPSGCTASQAVFYYDLVSHKLKVCENGGAFGNFVGGGGGGSGDVAGPASATDNAIVRFDGTGGKTIQNSVVTIADTTGNIAGVGTLNTHTVPGGTSTFTLRSDNLSVFASTTSAQLAGVISNETGSGALVFGTGPSIGGAIFTSAPRLVNNVSLLVTKTDASTVNGLIIDGSDGLNLGEATLQVSAVGTKFRAVTGGDVVFDARNAGVAVGRNNTDTSFTLDVSNRASSSDTVLRVRGAPDQVASSQIVRIYDTDGTTLNLGATVSGVVATYAGKATAGIGVPAIYAAVATNSLTASVSSTSLQVDGGIAPAGTYKVYIYVKVTSAGSGSLTTTIGFNDGTAARTITTPGVNTGATNFETQDYGILVDGSNNITYSTTLTGTGTYSIRISLVRDT